MGMFSANQSRAPHASLLFISSKIKATNNNTLVYLSSHPESETLVRKAVTVGTKLRRCTQTSVAELQSELSTMIGNKMQKKGQGERKKMEKKVKEIMSSSDQDFEAAFPSLDSLSLELLLDILSGLIVGKTIIHNWAQEGWTVLADHTYNGKVEKKKKTKVPSYVV